MIRRIRRGPWVGKDDGALVQETDMKWETPQATDFRFGMEITMYIAKR